MRTYTDPEMRRTGSLNEMKRLAQGAPRPQVNSFGPAPNYGSLPNYGVKEVTMMDPERVRADAGRLKGSYASQMPPQTPPPAQGAATPPQQTPPSQPAQPKSRLGKVTGGLRHGAGGLVAVEGALSLAGALNRQNYLGADEIDARGGFTQSTLKEAFPSLSAAGERMGQTAGYLVHGDPNKPHETFLTRLVSGTTPGLTYGQLVDRNIGYRDASRAAEMGAPIDRPIAAATTAQPVNAAATPSAAQTAPSLAQAAEQQASPNRIWKSTDKDGRVAYSNTPTEGATELTQANMRGTVNTMSREAFMAPPPGTPGLAARAAIMERNIAEAEAAGDPRAANMMRAELNRLSEAPESEKTMRQSLADIAKMPERTFDEKFAKRNAMGLLDRRLKMEGMDQQQGQFETQGMAQRRIEGLQGQLMEAYGKGDAEEAARIEKQLSALVPQQRQPDRKFVGNFRDVRAALSVPVADATGGEKLQPDPERERQFFAWMAKSGLTDMNEALAAYMAMQQPAQNPKVMSKEEFGHLKDKFGEKKARDIAAKNGMTVEG